jgi:hypothetical protein
MSFSIRTIVRVNLLLPTLVYIIYKIDVQATSTSCEVEMDGRHNSRRNSKQAVLFGSTCKVSYGRSDVLTRFNGPLPYVTPSFIIMQSPEVRCPVSLM